MVTQNWVGWVVPNFRPNTASQDDIGVNNEFIENLSLDPANWAEVTANTNGGELFNPSFGWTPAYVDADTDDTGVSSATRGPAALLTINQIGGVDQTNPPALTLLETMPTINSTVEHKLAGTVSTLRFDVYFLSDGTLFVRLTSPRSDFLDSNGNLNPHDFTSITTGTAPTHVAESTGHVTFGGPQDFVPCFAGSTLIATAKGERPARKIRIGDRLPTKDHGMQTVRYVAARHLTHTQLCGNPDLAPIRIAAGALGEGLPERDLVVSPQHAMLVQSEIAELLTGEAEGLVRAKMLLPLPGVERIFPEEGVDYVHLLFDRHEIIFAEGAQTESLFLGDQALETFDPEAEAELRAIFGTLDLDRQHRTTARLIPDGRTQTVIAAELRRSGRPAARAMPPFGPQMATRRAPVPHHV